MLDLEECINKSLSRDCILFKSRILSLQLQAAAAESPPPKKDRKFFSPSSRPRPRSPLRLRRIGKFFPPAPGRGRGVPSAQEGSEKTRSGKRRRVRRQSRFYPCPGSVRFFVATELAQDVEQQNRKEPARVLLGYCSDPFRRANSKRVRIVILLLYHLVTGSDRLPVRGRDARCHRRAQALRTHARKCL